MSRTVTIKSVPNSTNLIFYDDKLATRYGFLSFNGDDTDRPEGKFELVPSNTLSERVHIKCSYNGKFLQMESENSGWLSPLADCLEEDKSKWNCTLFELNPVPGYQNRYRVFHVYLQKNAIAAKDPPTGKTTRFQVTESSQHDIFEIIEDQPTPEAREKTNVCGYHG